MSALPERDAIMEDLIKHEIACRLMNGEVNRLQPELVKYESCTHPAARPLQTEVVSTSSLTEKTKVIKQEGETMKVIENDLSTLNERVATSFRDVEIKVSQRNSLLSEVEHATSMMNSLTVRRSQFEVDADIVRKSVHEVSNKMTSMTLNFQNEMKEKLSKLAALQKMKSVLNSTITVRQQRIKVLREKKDDNENKIDLESLTELKAKLDEVTENTSNLKEYLISVTKDEGRRMEILRSSITECDILKKKKCDLSNQLDEVNDREEKTIMEKEGKAKEVEESQRKLNEWTIKKEHISKNHETVMTELKERTDLIIDSLEVKKNTVGKNLEAMKKRIKSREECMQLRKELDAEGKIEALDLSEEIKTLKQKIEDTRAHITTTVDETARIRSGAGRYNAEADELQVSNKMRRVHAEKKLHEKDGVANHFEREVFNLKKKLEMEKIEREGRLALETHRLLEKAKEDKERKEREEKRRIEKEKEKVRKAKEEEEKKRAKEEQEKKKKNKDEVINRNTDAVQKKERTSAILTQVQQGRMGTAGSRPLVHKDESGMRPPKGQATLPSTMNLRPHNNAKKPMYILDDDSSEDDDDDMSDFLLDDSIRVKPKVPEKYAGSPPRVNKQMTPLNPFELSFTDVQSSTPARTQNNPPPSFEVSFNQVVTSTPQLPRGSKANKKQTRPRGKKRTK